MSNSPREDGRDQAGEVAKTAASLVSGAVIMCFRLLQSVLSTAFRILAALA
ncbi:MAG: hypothetical protein ACLFRK_02915 [Candidatus Nanohaloarchaea archaeon]